VWFEEVHVKLSQAIRIAVKAMEVKIKTLDVDANLYEQYGASYLSAASASRERRQLQEAIEVLKRSVASEKDQKDG
jgi:hypothetical protein